MANEEGAQDREIRLRRVVGDAYSAIMGEQSVQSFMNFTFEEALDLQLQQIEAEETAVRQSKMGKLDRLEQSIVAAVDEIKSLPISAFRKADEHTNVNTPKV